MTTDQRVAYNLRRLRRQKGWTQDEAAEFLEPLIGERWSRATFSAAERSVNGVRVRRFTIAQVEAFAAMFGVGIDELLADAKDPCPTCGGLR